MSKNLNSDNIRAVKIVRIKVDDVNNNFPVFATNLSPVEIPEDTKAGSLFNINQYKATDADCSKLCLKIYILIVNDINCL